MRGVLALVGLVLVVAAMLGGTAPAMADGSWIDQPLVSWNAPGTNVPLPGGDQVYFDDLCVRQLRAPETPEEAAVADAGWYIGQGRDLGSGVFTVLGYTGTDGMCRAMNYNVFVFVYGAYAGKISPVEMGSRVDGSGNVAEVSAAGDQLVARYARYSDSDPLCCPSRSSRVTFAIVWTEVGPVLEPVAAVTMPFEE